MKTFVLALCFASVCCIVVPIQGQSETKNSDREKANPANTIQSAHEETRAAVGIVDQQTSNNQSDRAPNQSQGYFSRLFSAENLPNLILCLVGIAGVRVAVKTLKHIQKQTNILVEYNKATRDSADAALLNAKAAVTSQRPFVFIGIKTYGDDESFMFVAGCSGNSPAEVIEYYKAHTLIDAPDNLERPPKYGTPLRPRNSVLVPCNGMPVDGQGINLLHYDPSKESIPNGKISVFYFKIVYRDFVTKTQPDLPDYVTCECFVYGRELDVPIIAGPPEYNKHT